MHSQTEDFRLTGLNFVLLNLTRVSSNDKKARIGNDEDNATSYRVRIHAGQHGRPRRWRYTSRVRDLVMINDHLVVLAYNVDTELLRGAKEHWERQGKKRGRRTTMSSIGVWLDTFLAEVVPADKMPFELLTSLMSIFPFSCQTSVCWRERTFESK